MRIAVVNAHFPPNFVSGGTLQPQRLARGLRARGHDVFVYTGHLDAELPALYGWNEFDETGLPIRRIVITPYTNWADWQNFDNPAVRDDFARWLDDVRPDVVHAHSVQGLGAGLLGAAKEAGAKVVLSMHDFWWFCARQFLADTTITPCCPVVEVGTCPCETTRPFLDGRRAYLARQLAARRRRAGSVRERGRGSSPPTASTRQRCASTRTASPSGLARRWPRAPSTGADVRFLYYGGSHPLKGIGVLLEACRAMPSDGWTLNAYGSRDCVASGVSLGALPVRLRPPFDPAATDRILAQHDVLVVPSVMRESYSLATQGRAGPRAPGDRQRQPRARGGRRARAQRPARALGRSGGARPRDAPVRRRSRDCSSGCATARLTPRSESVGSPSSSTAWRRRTPS